jgi:hypothetical protein
MATRAGNRGQVVGGVLRGEKARFQLFGDTSELRVWLAISPRCQCHCLVSLLIPFVACAVNMASRMESTGVSHFLSCTLGPVT